MFEPCHGSAPDFKGQNRLNPIATILSASMMLKYSFNMDAAADDIEKAVMKTLQQGYRTEDIMSEGMTLVGTKEMGDAIAANI